MRSASAPAPDVTTTVVAESTVNVSAGVICTDTGIGTMECASRAAATGCGGPGGCGRPQAARTTAAPDTNARHTPFLHRIIFNSRSPFRVQSCGLVEDFRLVQASRAHDALGATQVRDALGGIAVDDGQVRDLAGADAPIVLVILHHAGRNDRRDLEHG